MVRAAVGSAQAAAARATSAPVASARRNLHEPDESLRVKTLGSAQSGLFSERVDADAIELRVLGCLVEKQRTTPDIYPLSLNALRLACNQSTNRDPVVEYDEPEIRAALDRLSRRGWARLASGPGSRAVKYRHLFDEAVGVTGPEISVLAVLMLRGAQTIGELKQRTERLHAFGSLAEVDEALHALAQRELVARLERRPGQKEERWTHLLGGAAETPAATPRMANSLEERVGRLEREVAELRGLLRPSP
jgi:uncharacterized protein